MAKSQTRPEADSKTAPTADASAADASAADASAADASAADAAPADAAPATPERLYVVLSPLEHDGKLYGREGYPSEVMLNEEVAAVLIRLGVLKEPEIPAEERPADPQSADSVTS